MVTEAIIFLYVVILFFRAQTIFTLNVEKNKFLSTFRVLLIRISRKSLEFLIEALLPLTCLVSLFSSLILPSFILLLLLFKRQDKMKRQYSSILSFLFFIASFINHIYAYPNQCGCSYAIAVGTNFGVSIDISITNHHHNNNILVVN